MSTVVNKKSKLRKFLGTLSTVLNAEFFFFLEETLLDFIQNSLGQFIFTPLTMGLAGFNAFFSSYELYKAKNKNISKISAFLLDSLLFTLISTFGVLSLVGGILGSATLLLISAILVPVVCSVSMFYKAGLSLFFFFKYFMLDEKKDKKLYLKKAMSNAFQAGLFACLTAALTLLFVFGVATKAMAVACIVLSSTALIFGLAGVIKKVFFCNNKQATFHSSKSVDAQHVEEKAPANQAQVSNSEQNSAENSSQCYSSPIMRFLKRNDFACENRVKKMHKFKSEEGKKSYLSNEITKKIDLLKIEQQKFPKKAERITKQLLALDALQNHFANGEFPIHYNATSSEKTDQKPYDSRADFYKAIPNEVFSNIFQEKTDMEDLFDATFSFLDHLEKKKNEEFISLHESDSISFVPKISPYSTSVI